MKALITSFLMAFATATLVCFLLFGCGGGGGGEESSTTTTPAPVPAGPAIIEWEESEAKVYQVFINQDFIDEVITDEWYVDDTLEVNKEYRVGIRAVYGEADQPVWFTLIVIRDVSGCTNYEIVPDAGYEANFNEKLKYEVCDD